MKQVISWGVAVICAASFPAMAQTAATDVTVTQPDTLFYELKGVEITANRAGVKTPVAYTNISRNQIAKVNDGRDIPAILEMSPSIISTSDAGAGIGYSGIRVRGSDGSRINITANGIPINDSESHNVYWVNMPDLASSVRDIQIQRGAGTSTNGAGAFGASINMLTDAPTRDRSALVSVSYGSFNSNKETIKVSSGLFGEHWSADARFSHIGSDGYIDRAFSKLWSYMGQLAYRNGETSLRLIAFGGKEQTYMAWDYASKEEMEKYGRRYNPCGKYTAADGTTAYYPDQCDNFTQHHIQLLFNNPIGQYMTVNAALHYTKGDGYYDQYKTGRTLSEYGLEPFVGADGELVKKSDLIRLKNNDNDFGGAMVNVRYKRGPLAMTAGGASNYHRGNHFGQIKWVRNYVGAINPLQQYYYNTGRKSDTNFFVRGDYDISSAFAAYADLQYRHIHYTINGESDNFDWNTDKMAVLDLHRDWNFFNPKVGVSFNRGGHRAYASWSVAHKEPTRDNFTDSDPGHYPTAERMFDYEAGYFYNCDLFSVGANLYFMDYKDQLVVTGQLSDTGNPMSVNVPDSYRAGIEFQGMLKPVNWFDWQLNATLSRNRIKNFVEYIYEDEWTNPISIDCGNTPIAFSPDFILQNAFNFKAAGAEISLLSRYVSSQYMNNAKSAEARLDSYFVTDLALGYTFTNLPSVKDLRLGITVYNLFNEKYCNNGYAGAGYYLDNDKPVIYRYAGYAAQATTNVLATVTLRF
ncbi:MAG: TonB-dependent receptor plug domain-containing protein [Muribaculaceae bacterium]|nr:TonB-dependent receptor plug domain-containing protein [Muribaculaceae bacterium]